MTDHIWQRSSFCPDGGNNCVEVTATHSDEISIRESESPAAMVATDRTALRALVLGVKAGGIDLRRP